MNAKIAANAPKTISSQIALTNEFRSTQIPREHIAKLNIIGGIFFALSVFLLVKAPQDYLLVPLINSCVFLITGLLGLYIVFRRFGVSFKFQGYKNIRQQLKAALMVESYRPVGRCPGAYQQARCSGHGF